MAIKLIDIAERAGVSRGTVDRALHHRGGVRSDVEALINQIAEEMGYEPNRAGKVLAAQKRAIRIGCLIPSMGNVFFDDVIKGMQSKAEEFEDYNVTVDIIQVKGYETLIHQNALQKMAETKYDGLCLTTLMSPEIRKVLSECFPSTPIVSVNVPNDFPTSICYVGPDYYKDGLTSSGIFSLITKNQQKLLLFTGSFNMSGHMERINGFLAGLTSKGIPYQIVKVCETNDDDREGYEKTRSELEKHPDITTIFVATAGIAGICRAVEESGKTIHIVGFDDVPQTKDYIIKHIIDYTICQEPVTQGKEAISRMFDYLMSNHKARPSDFITHSRIKIAENINEE